MGDQRVARASFGSAVRALCGRAAGAIAAAWDAFPFGKAPFVILVGAVVSAGWLLAHPVTKTEATLRVWTFATTHAEAYRKALPAFEAARPGVKVDLQLVHWEAVTSRLRAAFWTDLDVPDLVEVEISAAGSFFRGPPEEIGFEDLTPRLASSGLLDRLVRARLAPYTCRGRIYGLPHDVHPVMLAYRRDIFEAEGVDASALVTWDDFVRAGRRLTRLGERYMIQLSDAGSHNLEALLFQRGGGYFDAEGRVTMDDEIALETLLWYIPLVAGPDRIASDPGGGQGFAQAFEDGYILSTICPDWRSKGIENDVPRLAGKLALMPLPAARPLGRRTTTWGGTMVGITKKCAHKDLAWELACHLYLNPDDLAERFREMNILPPLRDAWGLEAFREPRSYWSGQRIGELYAALGDDVPPQYTSPYINLAKSKLGSVVAACAAHYNRHGADGFVEFARARLRQAGDELRKYMKRNPF